MSGNGLIVFAHVGHWSLYAIPIIVVLVAVVITALRERREREHGD